MGDRGKKVASSSQGDDVIPLKAFPHIKFRDAEQKTKFKELYSRKFIATRFLDTNDMTTLGIHDDMRRLAVYMGLGSLFNMSEMSYQDITLEFLSSLSTDAQYNNLKFRLRNHEYECTLDDVGNYFGFQFRRERIPEGCTWKQAWTAMTGNPNPNVSKLKIKEIQDPRLRIWIRLMMGTLFTRPEKDRASSVEALLIGCGLNICQTGIFMMDIPRYMVKNWVNIAEGSITTIECGGMITLLARNIMNFTGRSKNSKPFVPSIPLLDIAYLQTPCNWLGKGKTNITSDGECFTTYGWFIGKQELPLPAPLASLVRLGVVVDRRQFVLPSYLIDLEDFSSHRSSPQHLAQPRDSHPTTSRAHSPPHTHATGVAPPPYSPNTIDRVNRNLVDYHRVSEYIDRGYYNVGQPVPSYYQGAMNFPGSIFTDSNVDPNLWGAYHTSSFSEQARSFYARPRFATTPGGSSQPDHDEDADDDDRDGGF